MKLNFWVYRAPQRRGYEVFIESDGARVTDIKIVADNSEPTGLYTPPPLVLREEDAQQLFQELWDVGLRPNNGEGTSAQVEAIKYHLEDMRRLVFDINQVTVKERL